MFITVTLNKAVFILSSRLALINIPDHIVSTEVPRLLYLKKKSTGDWSSSKTKQPFIYIYNVYYTVTELDFYFHRWWRFCCYDNSIIWASDTVVKTMYLYWLCCFSNGVTDTGDTKLVLVRRRQVMRYYLWRDNIKCLNGKRANCSPKLQLLRSSELSISFIWWTGNIK